PLQLANRGEVTRRPIRGERPFSLHVGTVTVTTDQTAADTREIRRRLRHRHHGTVMSVTCVQPTPHLDAADTNGECSNRGSPSRAPCGAEPDPLVPAAKPPVHQVSRSTRTVREA